jgi:predicted nucleic acid-binding protein
VKLFVTEPGSPKIISLVEGLEDRLKSTSVLALVEVRSAIRRRQFAGDTLQADADFAVLGLRDESRRMIQYPVSTAILELAGMLVDKHNLRALDSVQLATAMIAADALEPSDNLRFAVSDLRLLKAARAEGLTVWDPTA